MLNLVLRALFLAWGLTLAKLSSQGKGPGNEVAGYPGILPYVGFIGMCGVWFMNGSGRFKNGIDFEHVGLK